MPRRPERRFPVRVRRASSPVLAVIAAAAILSGCTASPEARPTPTASPTPSATPSPTPTVPAAPVLVPDGDAADNLPLFTQVVGTVWAGPENVAGRAYIDALVAAGFDKSAMQVTYDESTVGNPAESIQFSVRWGEECLVGQIGPATGAPVAAVLPGLAEGGCLVGATRPIDW